LAALDPIRDWHQVAVESLMTDADLALQYITALFGEDDATAAARVVRSARETYDLILTKRRNLTISAGDSTLLDDKMDRLRARLKFLGEKV
jgi:hypothetical protein